MLRVSRWISRVLFPALCALCALAPAHASISLDTAHPNPENRCFADVLAPAQYEWVRERVEVTPSVRQERWIPAAIEYQNLRIVTKQAGLEYFARPPVYTLSPERVLVAPERFIEVDYPAKYETWTEKIEIEPAKLSWKPCSRVFGRTQRGPAINITGSAEFVASSVMCRIHVAAKERIVQHTRLVQFPRRVIERIPAQYKTIMRQRVMRPGSSGKKVVSEQFSTVQVAHQVSPAQVHYDTIPATYADVETMQEIRSARIIQAEVLCGQHITRDLVTKLQSKLVEQGFAIAIDGVHGPETQRALEAYQQRLGLAQGVITAESVHALGISVPNACARPDCGPGAANPAILATQQALLASGFDIQVDGILGSQTQRAINEYQNRHGLTVGYLNAETMNALKITRWI